MLRLTTQLGLLQHQPTTVIITPPPTIQLDWLITQDDKNIITQDDKYIVVNKAA